MTTTVSNGGVTTQGTRTYLFGQSSGIDTSALVEVAYNARVAPADKIDVQVKSNTAKHDAYAKLQTLATAVQTSLTNLRKSYGFASTTNNYTFDKRSGTLSTDSTTDPAKLLTVAIDAGTALTTHEIIVNTKATANRIGSGTTTTDATAALGYTGAFDIGIAGNTASNINITNGMSLNDVATAINATSTTSGVSASVLNVDGTHFQLILSGSKTAKAITISNVTGTDVMQSLGVTSGGAAAHVLQPANQASLTVDNVPITRDNNQIDDLFTGVHFTINAAEPGTKLELNVQNDTSSVKDAILSFTEAYNSLRDYVVTNQTVSSTGEVSADAVLFGDYLMKGMSSDVQKLISSAYGSGNGTDLSSLGQIGVTLGDDNKFTVDEAKLDSNLISSYDQIKAIFTTSLTSDNSQFAVLANKSITKSLNVNLDITMSGGAISSVSVAGDSSLFTVSGTSIVGKKGTIYEGMSMAYVGTTNTTVNLKMTQGIADMMDNTLNNYTDTLTGSLTREKQRLDDLNTDMSSKAATIRDKADAYRNSLIDKYAGYESQIAQSKSVLAQLKAILGTSSSS